MKDGFKAQRPLPNALPIPDSFLRTIEFSDGSIVQNLNGIWYAKAKLPPDPPTFLLNSDNSVRKFETATLAILALMVALPDPIGPEIVILDTRPTPLCPWGR